ncbi:MAG TPA: ABC transporter permease [Gemmatimonadaceae bacterium]|nr:ABC transporter permease [Gemmatimonadaceae bacterium]
MKPIVRFIATTRERLRGLLFRKRVDAELEEELRFHMEMEAAELVRSGTAPDEAPRIAAATLGGVERYKDEVRDARGLAWIPGLYLDFVLGMRMMRKHSALSIVGGLGMAVGVAMSVGMFVFIRANIYPTIPLDEGDRIVAIENRDVTVNNEDRRVLHDFLTWRRELKSVTNVGAFRSVSRNLAVGDAPPEPVEIAEMSAAGFALARVPAVKGRFLLPDDERADRPPVMVIGFDVWKNRFAGREDIIGYPVKVAGVVHSIVGVMPEGFAFPVTHRYWVPLAAEDEAVSTGRRKGSGLYVFGRLADGATLESAQAELSIIGRRAAGQYPENAKLEPMVMPYIHSITDIQGIQTLGIVMMQAMMTLLLVVVAVNVAMLVYARTATRQGEIAVRTALGASRTRIIGQLFMEALTLALFSAAVGLGIGYVGVSLGDRIMQTEMGGSPFWISYRLDPWIILYTIGIAVFTAAIVGVLPALQATGKRLEASLRSLSGSALRLGKTWTTLIIAQVALAVAVLPATVNFAWSEMRGGFTRTTYDASRYLLAELVIDESDRGARPDRVAEVIRRLEEVPGIEDAAYRTSFAHRRGPIEAEGVASPGGTSGFRVASKGVSPDHLSLYGLRLAAGRGLTAGDMDTASTAVVVSRRFASRIYGTANPLGRRVRYAAQPAVDDAKPREASRWFEIVGVVDNDRENVFDPELVVPELYYAVSPEAALRGESIVIQARMGGTTLASVLPSMRRIASQVDPTMRLGRVIQQSAANRQAATVLRLLGLALGLILLSVFLLSAAGIYALVSFTITRRRKEIGIRSALGATQRQVLVDVLRPVGRQVLIGIAIGIAGAAAVDRASGQELLGGRAGLLLPAFAIAMAIVAVVAAFGPARRGVRIQPTEALRAES